MTDPKFEVFLAKVFVDTKVREAFLKDPRGEALRAGLTAEQADALEQIDRKGLELAARSFGIKRSKRGLPGGH